MSRSAATTESVTATPSRADEGGLPTVVCVLGMSRTGTSLTTRLLNLGGVYLGPEEGLLRPLPPNPEGFWEHFRLMRLNERILKALGGSWRDPPRMPPGWEESPALAEERELARSLLDETFAGRRLWGWKDPRNSLTLPFWQQLVPNMRYVVCLRNPIDVAASLARRDGIHAEHAFSLWLTYVASALVNTSGRRRLLVAYERFFEDGELAAGRLVDFVADAVEPPRADARRQLGDAIKQHHWHHRTPAPAAVGDGRLPADIASLHLISQLLEATGPARTRGRSGRDDLELAVDSYARRLLDAAPATVDPSSPARRSSEPAE